MRKSPSQILALHKSGRKKYKPSTISKAAKEMSKLGASAGGNARAAKLSCKEAMTIARHAANQRWGNDCPKDCEYCERAEFLFYHEEMS